MEKTNKLLDAIRLESMEQRNKYLAFKKVGDSNKKELHFQMSESLKRIIHKVEE